MKKKKSLTLLEVVICMVVMGTLLTGLFNCYRHFLKSQIAAKQLKSTVQELQLCNQRIGLLLSAIDPSESNAISLHKHPQALSEALLIRYEQKYDREREYTGSLQAMLYIDERKRLCSATWSKAENVRMETLLENIQSIEYLFFDKVQAKWLKEWSKDKKMMPAMIKLTIKKESKDISWVYFLDLPSDSIEMHPKPSHPVKMS